MSALHIRYGKVEALPLDILLSAIPSLPRVALDRLVERAIEEMDNQDGDPDLEDEPADDSLDALGELPSDDGRSIHAVRPIYGEDQSAGPINYEEAEDAFLRKEYGLDD